MSPKTSSRKMDHLKIVSSKMVQAKEKTTLFEDVELVHQALPEVDEDEIDLSVKFFGKKLNYPLIISGMTGGHKAALKINKNLAIAAQETGIAMGVGSQRAMLENPDLTYTYQVKEFAPDLPFLVGNIGAPQLAHFGIDGIKTAYNSIEADAMAIHLNNLQEAVQKEGDTSSRGYLNEIKKSISGVNFPIIIKETGGGISKETTKKLIDINATGIDVGGAGGTSWSAVELLRGNRPELKDFWDWGIPTAASILEVRSVSAKIPLIATGGLRTGLDIAKAIALGADVAGLAYPFFKAAERGPNEVINLIENLAKILRTTMFLVGAKNTNELKQSKYVLFGTLLNWSNYRNLKHALI